MSRQPGTLVRARGRDWVVLPSDDADLLRLRPLDGTDDDAVGLFLPLEGEDVADATFVPPNPEAHGDFVSARLLLDAVRLGLRSGAGPFRSLGRISVEPRSYQLVPLLMALRQDPVRLLIADDVGIGKTIESALIARELLDRGEIQRIAVLCPPHLCEQWQQQLREHLQIDAEVVRPGTVTRLERGLPIGRSLFEEYPFIIVSIDYIKSDRRRADFVRACPEMVIVDEAHTCSEGTSMGGGQQQRHRLLTELVADPERHLIMCTATPHSGVETAFRSLVGLLDPDFRQLPEDLERRDADRLRRRLAQHFVQRRRGDIVAYLGEATEFPVRASADLPYEMSPEQHRLLDRVMDYAREIIRSSEGATRFRQRVSWWAALALLRCVGSSPMAAAAALRTRAGGAGELDGNESELDERGMRAVLDQEASESADEDDAVPGADTLGDSDLDQQERRRLLALARDAEALAGIKLDRKLSTVMTRVRELLAEGFSPIVFCRYVATAEYVADQLREAFAAERGPAVAVESVTGVLPPEVRHERVAVLGESSRRVLVATDCLSEGIDLQHSFDAIVHYDLSWNPTRHEQRDGRVDRFGQAAPEVRSALVFGSDNPIDGAVLEVILRKAAQIRRDLGVSVPVPIESDSVLEAILEAVVLRREDARQLQLDFDQAEQRLDWERLEERERRTRTIFAQATIDPKEVLSELQEAHRALGTHDDVLRFVRDAMLRFGVPLEPEGRAYLLNTTELPDPIKRAIEMPDQARIAFTDPAPRGTERVSRLHPLVERTADYLTAAALENEAGTVSSRSAAIRSSRVTRRTTVLLLRLRHQIENVRRGTERKTLLAEECVVAAYDGSPDAPSWLDEESAIALLDAVPEAAVPAGQRVRWIEQAVGALPQLQPALDAIAEQRAVRLADSHQRVRQAGRRGGRGEVTAHLPVDVLGCYVIAPVATD